MLLKSVSNRSAWHFHYNLFSGTLQTVKISENKETYRSTSGKNFRIIFAKLDTWHVVQVHSWEEAQNNKL
jgi:hypothetical protein